MKKKVLAVLLTATMCFSIAACGKDDSRRDRDDEEEEETGVVETEETTVATTTVETRERETVATTETSVEDNAPSYNPEDVDMNFFQVDFVAPVIGGNIDFQWSAQQYVDQICSDAGIDDYWNYVHLPVFWYPEGNEPEPIPFTADYFTPSGYDSYVTNGDTFYGDIFFYFSEDSICSNIIFQASRLNEVCVIVGTDADSLPTLTSIYESTDGSQTLDEVIANNENIIVPTFVDRQDTAHIDAELAQAIPGAQITYYNPYGYLDYNVVSEYDLFDGPGTYYMRVYVKSDEGEWHVTSDTPLCIIVVDPVEAGFLNSYN